MLKFSTIAAPLTEINKENFGFKWRDEKRIGIQHFERKAKFDPLLHLLDFTKTFEIECDASLV